MKIKPIETEYKGYKFRSRLEARWAVFFDACGVKWEYEPEGFDLGDGLYYLPDFLLHDVIYRYNQSERVIDLWVEVKGQMTETDWKKIEKFNYANPAYSYSGEQRKLQRQGYIMRNPLLVLSRIPEGTDFWDIRSDIEDINYNHKYFFNFETLDIDNYTAFPVITEKNKFALVGAQYIYGINETKTVLAYTKARQARFDEKSHKPRVKFIKHCDFNADGYCYRSKDYANDEYIYGVSFSPEVGGGVSLESRSGDSWGMAKLKYLEKFIGYSADDSEIWIKVFD